MALTAAVRRSIAHTMFWAVSFNVLRIVIRSVKTTIYYGLNGGGIN